MFYVYEWFIIDTGEIIYVGKGCKNRYRVRKHNKLFNSMIEQNHCSSRIVKTFDSEDEAFKFEYDRISELKSEGQCVCNIARGGFGGASYHWTEEKRDRYSKSNVMKSEKQRERMSKNNPMKNKDIAMRVGYSHQRPVILDGMYFSGVKLAAKVLGVAEITVSSWCKRGYDTEGRPCRYEDEPQKEYSPLKKSRPLASNMRPVVVDGTRYETVKDGANAIGVYSESLIRAIKENRKCKSHECKYADQQPSCGNPIEVPQKVQRLTSEDGNQ